MKNVSKPAQQEIEYILEEVQEYSWAFHHNKFMTILEHIFSQGISPSGCVSHQQKQVVLNAARSIKVSSIEESKNGYKMFI